MVEFKYGSLSISGYSLRNKIPLVGNQGEGELILPDEEILYTVYFENLSGTEEFDFLGAATRNIVIVYCPGKRIRDFYFQFVG